jgi:uracil-DNA glycosylase family 4
MKILSVKEKQKALDQIAKEIESCAICKQGKIGKAVPGEGNADADVVFLGEAPGKKEAQSGRPFIGPAGKILRELIKDAGLKEEDVFITSPVKYLPEYVTPTPEDVAHGRTHLFKQLDIIQPKIIVLMGRIAALAMLERNVSVAKEHGTIIEKDGRKYLLAYHPAAPLYSPKVKEELIKDFKKLKKLISK